MVEQAADAQLILKLHVNHEIIWFYLHPFAQVFFNQGSIVVMEMSVVNSNKLVDLVFKVVQVQLEFYLVA